MMLVLFVIIGLLQYSWGYWSGVKAKFEKKEMLKALIELVKDGINNYQNNHRKTAREYYSNEIKLIEKATGKTWEEICQK